MTAKISDNHQITIPDEIWDDFGFKEGDEIEFTVEDDASVSLRVKNEKPNVGLADLLFSCPYPLETPERMKDLPRDVEI